MCAAGYTGFFAEDTSLKRDVLFFHPTIPEDRGFMGKIRSFFEPSSGAPMFSSGFSGGAVPQSYGNYAWSMEDYRDQLRQFREQNQGGKQEDWDELEKSVIAKAADDVKISIRARIIEMTVLKKMN